MRTLANGKHAMSQQGDSIFLEGAGASEKGEFPFLLIHGMADDNSGTFPIQSERMFQAIKGNGGIVRYVQLPYEAHGYLARESTEHTLWEMVNWFDKWVKNAQPETPAKIASAAEK